MMMMMMLGSELLNNVLIVPQLVSGRAAIQTHVGVVFTSTTLNYIIDICYSIIQNTFEDFLCV